MADSLVSGEADQPGRHHPAQVLERLRVDQPVHGLPAGHHCRERHHPHDEEPGKVLRPPKPERVAAGGRLPAQDESDPQRHRRQGIGKVVDGVREQRHGTAEQHHHELQHGSTQQHEQADFQCTDPSLGAGLHSVVDRICGVVRVGDEQLHQPALEAAVVMVAVVMAVLVPVAVAVPVVGVPGRLLAGSSHDACPSPPWPGSRWWAGSPPNACSAWKMASATSCRACSFSSRYSTQVPSWRVETMRASRIFARCCETAAGDFPTTSANAPHGHFAAAQRQDDPHPRGVGQHGKDLNGQLHVLAVRCQRASVLICIHAHIVSHECHAPHYGAGRSRRIMDPKAARPLEER